MYKKYSINGNDYPFVLDLIQWEHYEDLTGEAFFSVVEGKLKNSFAVLFSGLVRGSQLHKGGFDMVFDEFKNELTKTNKKPGEIIDDVVSLYADEFEDSEEEENEKKL